MKIIDFIGVPMNLGARRLGVELGVETLRKICFSLNSGRNEWRDLGNVECRNLSTLPKDTTSKLPYLEYIIDANMRLRDMVLSSLRAGHFPFVAGGDHALAWGSIAGVMQYYDEFGVVYVDAHGDFNPAEFSPSHNIHGMHMAYLMGFDKSQESANLQCGKTISKDNVRFLATRSLDTEETRLAEADKMKIAWNRLMPLDKKLPIHLSFDIDSLDPKVAPGTGVPEKNGLSLEEGIDVLRQIFEKEQVVSMDFVEFNPLLDECGKTDDVAKRLMLEIDSLIG